MDDELLTMDEITRRCDGEWVLLDRIEGDTPTRIHKARLVMHSADEREVWAAAHQLPKGSTVAVFAVHLNPLRRRFL